MKRELTSGSKRILPATAQPSYLAGAPYIGARWLADFIVAITAKQPELSCLGSPIGGLVCLVVAYLISGELLRYRFDGGNASPRQIWVEQEFELWVW